MRDLFKADHDDIGAHMIALIPQMRAFARSICKDQTFAEDLTQDALAKAWSRRNSFTPGTNLRAWLFIILRNTFYSHQRRAWRSTQFDPEVAARTLSVEPTAPIAVELNELRAALNMLPRGQREALVLVAAAGISYDEAAIICHVATGTMKSRVNRARAQLLDILARGGIPRDVAPSGDAMTEIFSLVSWDVEQPTSGLTSSGRADAGAPRCAPKVRNVE